MLKGFSNEFQFTGVKVLHSSAPLAQPAKKPAPCCANCGQKAFFFLSQVDGIGNVKSKSLCLSHAYKAGVFHPKSWDLLGMISPATPAKKEILCRCGMSENILRLKGRVGCPHCYKVFGKILKPLLPKIHHASIHAGKSPKKASPRINVRRSVEVLKEAMSRAIRQEAYEKAAVLRDQISALAK